MAQEEANVRSSADAGEAADFGDEATDAPADAQAAPAKAAPQRAMPDYGDLVDGDEDVKKNVAVKTEPASDAASAPKRLDAIFVGGVARLNRTQIAEVFESKGLPEFLRVDWLSDGEVVLVFNTDQEAATVLRSASEGFRDVPDDGDDGPGLWRARRGMMDFRQATTADQPDVMFKKQHRGGRQVREFRLFAAMTDMDKQILAREEEIAEQRKRPAPEVDDLDAEGPAKKRRRDPNSIDLLEKMMSVDKRILVKQEENGELEALPVIEDEPEEGTVAAWERHQRLGTTPKPVWDNDRSWQKTGGRSNQSWKHDSREDDDDWGSRRDGPYGKSGKGGKRGKKGKGDRSGKGDKKGRGKGKSDQDNGPVDASRLDADLDSYFATKSDEPKKRERAAGKNAVDALGAGVEETAEEADKRAKRSQRFEKKPENEATVADASSKGDAVTSAKEGTVLAQNEEAV